MTRARLTLAWTTAVFAAAGIRLAACPVCFQVDDGPVADGVRMAVFVLIGATIVVLAPAAFFLARFIRRDRRLARADVIERRP